MEEFYEDANILAAISSDLNNYEIFFRNALESFINHCFFGDCQKCLMATDEVCKRKIQAVKTQKDYDALFKQLYDNACITMVISNELRRYCGTVERRIESAKHNYEICPCCGKVIDEEAIKNWQTDLNERKSLEEFYSQFCDICHKHLGQLRKFGAKNNFDLQSWQEGLNQTIGSVARVEDIVGKPSELNQILEKKEVQAKEEQRIAVEMAKNWLAGRSQN
ncbi:MAG: hypothetical protein IJU91_03290 [Selenomonadaceae bacterium]|nr:hypothetical protein [Selenomonadaceae bacterium]